MRRSASADRKSLVPLRVRNDDNQEASSSKSRKRSSSSRKSSIQSNMRSLSGNRTSIGGGRPSVGGVHKPSSQFSRPGQSSNRLSRGSGMGVRNNGVPKDPRPTSDKGYQHRCIKNVFQFLTDKGYPHNITTKMLQSPTNKDFIRIFEFMYSLLVPDHRPFSRPEEDIPKILKLLGYPFMISKSAMFAVGSPHMWPSILAALNWLAELIEYGVSMSGQERNIMFPPDEDSFDNISESQVLHFYLVSTYMEFLDGKDDFTEEVEALKISFKSKIEGSAGSIDDLAEENRILKMQIEELGGDKNKRNTEQQNLQMARLDEERMVSFISELESHKRQIDQQADETENVLTELETDIEAENAKFLKMQLMCESQEFSQEDVERLKRKGRDLQMKKDDIEKRIQSFDQEIWQKEISISKSMEQVDEKCQRYNKLAYSLKIIPISAENSNGIDFELQKLSLSNEEVSHFDKVIKPALNMMKRQCQDSCMSMETKKMTLAEQIEEISEVLSDIDREITLLTSKNKRLDIELDNKKQMYQSEREALEHSLEELEREKLTWNSGTLCSQDAFENEKKRLDKSAAMENEKMVKRLGDYKKFFQEAITIFLEHLDPVKKTILEARKISKDLYESTAEKARQVGVDVDTFEMNFMPENIDSDY